MAWTPLPETVELEVENPTPKEFVLDPAKTALIVVDMQYSVLKGKGPHPRSADVIPGIELLLAKARGAGAKVLYVESLRQAESPDHTLFKGPIHLQQGTRDAEMIEEIAPLPGEPVIQKWSNDVWSWYGIESVLEREGIIAGEWTVLVTGVSAAACAEAAALGFSNRLYRTLIPMDATAARFMEMEARIYALYREPEYSSHMDFTLSTMVSFAPSAAELAPREVATAV